MVKYLKERAKIIQAIRKFFGAHRFLEVETPIRIPAPAPEGHIDAQEAGAWYLQTSPELCMKELLTRGEARIFQICRSFRQNERGRHHLPEFTLVEWYVKGYDYLNMMDQSEALIRYVALELLQDEKIRYDGHIIDLTPKWRRITVQEAFDRFGGISMEQALAEEKFDEIMALAIEPRLGVDHPMFLYDYPIEKGALARRKKGQPGIAERFELYIAGIELCNAFSELTDPVEQRRRFMQEHRFRKANGRSVAPMPERFLSIVGNMPEAAGNALGVDRLVMVLTDTQTIDAVVAFTPEELLVPAS